MSLYRYILTSLSPDNTNPPSSVGRGNVYIIFSDKLGRICLFAHGLYCILRRRKNTPIPVNNKIMGTVGTLRCPIAHELSDAI